MFLIYPVITPGAAEGGEAVAELIEGDQQASDRGGDCGHAFLAKADDEREHCRATQACQGEESEAGERVSCGNERNEEEGHANDSGEDFENNSFGHPPVDRGEKQAPAGDSAPEEREGKGCCGGGV